jgi:hypothetical protein
LSELDALLEDLDEEQAAKVKALFAATNKEAELAKRDVRVRENPTFEKDHPRAWAALQKNLISLGDALTDADISNALAAEEKKLEALGVPIPGAGAAAKEPVNEPVNDPAAAFGGQPAGGGIPSVPDSTPELREAMDSGDGAQVIKTIHKLRKEGHARVFVDPSSGIPVSELSPIRQEYEADPHPNSVS